MLSKLTRHLMPEIQLGEENSSIGDFLCALLLAISPIAQHYRGIGPVDAGDGILLICAFYLIYRFFTNFRTMEFRNLILVFPLLLYYIYRVADHGTGAKEVVEALAICGYFAAAALGCINMRYLAVSSYLIAMAASLCIIMQYFCFYVFGFHLQLVCTSLLRPISAQWILCAQTGLAGITGVIRDFYRPSAFFLEPSHMFLYFIPHLFLLLLSPQRKPWKWISALILSVGLSFSTSGMGILVIGGVWLLFVGCSTGPENKIRLFHVFRIKKILLCVALLALYVLLYMTLPYLKESISRIFSGDINAIEGRVTGARELIRQMHGRQWLLGVTDSTSAITGNISGFHGTLYRYGLIGLVLSYSVYLRSVLQLDAQYRWMAIIIVLVSYFSTHTHATFYMLYYTFLLLPGFFARKEQGLRGLAPL